MGRNAEGPGQVEGFGAGPASGSAEGLQTGLAARISACRLCAPQFAATATAHLPRPVVWFRPGARVLIAGQAPGARVQASGRPFTDASGDRLRDWLGIGEVAFYDRARVAIVPMAFCFPGYDAKGADLPPPPLCAATWHAAVMAALGAVPLVILVGGAAQRWHLGRAATRAGVTATVADWRAHAPHVFPLPHPSWRNTGWLKRHPWFADELLPALRARLTEVLLDD
jgi:uracil-DNA glycosylase